MYPGQDFTMSCPISAQAYQWYKNGYPIPNACQKSLHFSPFVFGDDGFYSCKVRGNGQESICNAAYLKTAPNIVPPGETTQKITSVSKLKALEKLLILFKVYSKDTRIMSNEVILGAHSEG